MNTDYFASCYHITDMQRLDLEGFASVKVCEMNVTGTGPLKRYGGKDR